ncbi:diphosphomevalonate decarboxylase [Lewinellaceae bacterium SD302]|nr:diphosphomevalonate decarboxylase [Lewinellaceae bacterium SD302]
MSNTYENSSLRLITSEVSSGSLRWRCPSNIALVKYWGKYGNQLPRNPSVSFTLDSAATDTTLHYAVRTGEMTDRAKVELLLDGVQRDDFARRTADYFTKLFPIYPFLRQLEFKIETSNSFPHSAGIASSASGMSALACCLVDMEERLFEPIKDKSERWRKVSYLARLGSGSACRSVYADAAVWGELSGLQSLPGSANGQTGGSLEYAVPVGERLHQNFKAFHDDILLISSGEKSVSSSAGHGLMDNSPYAEPRYKQAQRNCEEMLTVLSNGDMDRFGSILESEALTLHALMMASQPPYLLMEPNTITAIRAVQQWRADTRNPLYFTLDAGPNLHLLYPDSIALPVRNFVREQLLPLTAEGKYIADRMGHGPEKLELSE